MSADVLKTRARNLQKALSEAFRQPVKLSQAYELIAREEGFPNWDTASAKLAGSEVAAAPMTNSLASMTSSPGTLTSSRPHHHSELPCLGDFVHDFNKQMAGLTVISGKPGSGKAHIASMLVETWSRSNQLCIDASQQNLVTSFRQAILNAMRLSPDIVYVGELSSAEGVGLVVNLLETGHRVVATLEAPAAMPLHEAIAWRIPELKHTDLIEKIRSPENWMKRQIYIQTDRH